MAPPTVSPDPAEPDLYWSGHSGWAMLPGLVVGAALSAMVMLGLLPLGDRVDLPEDTVAFLRFWLVLLGWAAAGLVWAYRGASYVYRLTPSHLYFDFGMLSRPQPPVPLAEVTGVETRGWALRRLFGVGTVIVRAEGRKPVRLTGVYRPRRFAAAVRSAAGKARGG